MIAPADTENHFLPLNMLHCNEEATIFELHGNEPQIHRLSEMGLRVGATVRMLRPGSPCLLALDGKRLSLRLTEDIEVLVSVTNASAVA